MNHAKLLAGLLLALPVSACGDDDDESPPDNVAGNYTISVTNDANGCGFGNYTVGDTATGVPLVVTQSGTSVTGELGGVAGVLYDTLLGSRVFTGTITENRLTMSIHGTRSANQGGCTYTMIATLNATSSGDALTGTVTYTTATNHSPECGTLETCKTTQRFNGTRPPT